jgi:hypothetical protein
MIASVVAVMALLGMTLPADATVILSFAQSVNGSTVTATNNAAHTTTTVVGTNIPVTISQFLGGGAPISAFLDFQLNSAAAATITSGQILQPYTGTFSFTSLPGDLGTNYLSSTFTDFVFGTATGSSLTLSSSEPPGHDTFTSDILDAGTLYIPRAISFGFADVTPPAAIVGTTLRGFTSSVSGTISANVAVPEPTSLMLLGACLASLGLVARARRLQPTRRRRRA